jgi:hypothetical protein
VKVVLARSGIFFMKKWYIQKMHVSKTETNKLQWENQEVPVYAQRLKCVSDHFA